MSGFSPVWQDLSGRTCPAGPVRQDLSGRTCPVGPVRQDLSGQETHMPSPVESYYDDTSTVCRKMNPPSKVILAHMSSNSLGKGTSLMILYCTFTHWNFLNQKSINNPQRFINF